MENHADAHCYGANFQLISFTPEECTFYPFLLEYAEHINVPICTGFTVFTLDSGKVVILDFVQGLWFVNRM